MKATYECVLDGKVLPRLVEEIQISKKSIAVEKVLADGAYDSNADVF